MSVYQSETIATLAAALAKAQAAIQPASKDKLNPAFRQHYADLTSVWDACRDALTSNGLSVVQMPIDAGEGRVGLSTMLLHSSGEYIQSVVSTRLVKDDPQGVGSALTYLRRYALSAMVGVVADNDDDGNAASQAPRQQQRPARPEPPQSKAAPQPTNGQGRPASAAEARRRFFERYGEQAGSTWAAVQGYLNTQDAEPTTIDGWIAAAAQARDAIAAASAAQAA